MEPDPPRMPVPRRLSLVFAALCTTGLLGGCGADEGARVLRLGHGLDAQHPVHRAMEEMARTVREASSGALRIEIYPSEQLGSERGQFVPAATMHRAQQLVVEGRLGGCAPRGVQARLSCIESACGQLSERASPLRSGLFDL